MLAKEPERRPADGATLLLELTALPKSEGPKPAATHAVPEVVAGQHLYSIVLAAFDDTTVAGRVAASEEETRKWHGARRQLEAALGSYRAAPQWLPDGSLLLTMLLSDSAHDQALQAARCALTIKARWPTVGVAMATGCGQQTEQELIGEVVDRAAGLLRNRGTVTLNNPLVAALTSTSVWLDELSASLLERRFVMVAVRGGALLHAEAAADEEMRPVLGTLSPCLGREEELTSLEKILDRCRYERQPQAVLITAASGVGKTRLRQEFLARLKRRSWSRLVAVCAGEVAATSPQCTLIGQVVRRLCASENGDSLEQVRQHLFSCCTEMLGVDLGTRTALQLGPLCGLLAGKDAPLEDPAVTVEAVALAAQLVPAFTTFLAACCTRAPVLLVLDDLQWTDSLSIELLESALRELVGLPLMVVALARPEVKKAFPGILKWPYRKEIHLSGLSRSASERLVRLVLGNEVSASMVARIVEQAAGNTLLLEELIRAERATAEEYGSRKSGASAVKALYTGDGRDQIGRVAVASRS